MAKIYTLILFVVAITSCGKPEDTDDSGGRKVYYDGYSVGIGSGAIFERFLTRRVCYDIDNDQVVWNKVNDHIISGGYINEPSGSPYSRTFIKGDFLVKIYPVKDDPASVSYKSNAVYFEKIDKRTGDIVISKKIINPSEYNITINYSISVVVADEDHFIFGCNNGNIYCYDINGNIVWQKSNLPIGDSKLSQGYANIFLNERRIYFYSVNPSTSGNELYCLDAQTGNTIWHVPGASYASERGLFFDNQRVIIISSCGYYFINKQTGQYINGAPYSPCGSFQGRAIGSIDGVTAIMFTKWDEIGVMHLPIPDPIPRHAFPDNPFNANYFMENGLIYGGGLRGSGTNLNKFAFGCYNYDRGAFNWKISYTTPPFTQGGGDNEVFDYKMLNNEIYILTNLHVENGNAIRNPVQAYEPPNNVFYSYSHPGVIVLDKQSGGIRKQITKMPAGPNGGFVYNFCVE